MEFDKDSFFGKPGQPVPAVSVEDLRTLHEFHAQHPNTVFGPGARPFLFGDRQVDERALGFRSLILTVMEKAFGNVWTGGQLSEAAVKASATMKLKWPKVGKSEKADAVTMSFLEETARQSQTT